MTQEMIRFNNMKNTFQIGSWWGNGEYKTIGQILKFIYLYCGMHLAERVLVGDGEVLTPGGRILATYTFDDNLEIPVFQFLNTQYDYSTHAYEENQRIYIAGLKNELN